MAGSQAHPRLSGWDWSQEHHPVPPVSPPPRGLVVGAAGADGLLCASMAAALPAAQPGETGAHDGWRGTGGSRGGQCGLQGPLPCTATGGRWQLAATRAGGTVAGRSWRAAGPCAGGLALSLLCHAALGPIPCLIPSPQAAGWRWAGAPSPPHSPARAGGAQRCPFGSTMPLRGLSTSAGHPAWISPATKWGRGGHSAGHHELAGKLRHWGAMAALAQAGALGSRAQQAEVPADGSEAGGV